MNVLVTGGAGFIGSHLVDALVERGHFVVAVDDLSGGTMENIKSKQAVIMLHGCENRLDMRAYFKRFSIDTLVHCAANAREGASQFQPYSVTKRNSFAYAATLSAAIEAGVKNVILFSSMAVYGKQQPPFDEALGMQPVDVYGMNKCLMETMTHVLASVHGFNFTVVRPHNVFGERQRMADKFRNVVAIFMNRILRDEPLFIYGDGKQMRAFSYIGDSLPCFVKVVEQCAEFNGETINVGGMQSVMINELAAEVLRTMGAPADYARDHYEDRPLEVKHAFSTYEKSEKLLGYADTIGWREGVQRMAVWAQEQGPQPWVNNELLEIVNELTPKPWLSD